MLDNKKIAYIITESSLQQKRRLLNISNALSEKNDLVSLTNDTFLYKSLKSKNLKVELIHKSGWRSWWKNSLEIRNLLAGQDYDIIHFFGIEGLIQSLPWLQKTSSIGFCFDFFPKKYPMWLKVLIRPFIQRFDHLFIPSRLSSDDVYLNLKLPPSRCTSLSLKDLMYSEKGEPQFLISKDQIIPSYVRAGIYLNSASQMGLLFRLKRCFDDERLDQELELHLIKDSFNESIFMEQSFSGFSVISPEDENYSKIDLWIVLGSPSEHPHLLRMFKNGAHLVSPSSSYLMELRDKFNEIISTYPKGDMRSAHDIVMEKSKKGKCANYHMTTDLEKVEIDRVVMAYQRSMRRRELAKKIL